jgi:predicted permease
METHRFHGTDVDVAMRASMDTFIQDIRFGFRLLLKNPGFTAIAACSLALGIGANAVVFCWIQNVLLRPLPGVRDQEEIVVLAGRRGDAVWDTVSYPDLKDYAKLKDVFAGVIGSQITPAFLRAEDTRQWMYGQVVTANFFDVLGVRPLMGRAFLPEENEGQGGQPVLVLSHGFWQRHFGGDPTVVGRPVELNRKSFTVVGVAPEGFHGTMSGVRCDFWAPLAMHREVANFGSWDARNDRWLHTQARLAPGVTRARAQAAVNVAARQLEAAYPDENAEVRLRVLPMWKSPYGGQAVFLPVLSVLIAVSGAVLLIVTANVANLLLARAAGREKEIAIRLAMGGGRWRLLRQLLTESLLLAMLGGALGTLLATWAADVFLAMIPPTHLPVGYLFRLDGGTLLTTLGLTLVAGLLFGLAPAVQMLRGRLYGALKEGGRGGSAGVGHHRLRGALVVTEVALALLLMVGAGLCLRGFQRARAADPGFDPANVLVAGLRIGMNGYTRETGVSFYEQLHQRLDQLPGVKRAALASWIPLGFEGGPGTRLLPEGYAPLPGEDLGAAYAIVTPGYFGAMRIGMIEGRDFTDRDANPDAWVVILNEAVARRFWPGENAVGRRVGLMGRTATVVGVVKTGKYRSLGEPPKMFVYFPYQQGVWDLNLGVVVRTEGDPLGLVGAVRREIHALDAEVEVWAAAALEDYIEAAFVAHRIATTLLILLGAVALVLSAMGIYGVMAFVVSQRTHEIGVRMALGAQTGDVLRMVLREGFRLGLIGAGVGLLGTLAVGRLLANFLYGVSPFDPWTFLLVAGLLGGVILVACLLPARRATRVDPLVALRYE